MTNKQPMLVSIHDFSKQDDDDKQNGNGTANGNQGASQPVFSTPPQQATSDNNDVPDILVDYNQCATDGDFTDALFREEQVDQVLSVLTTKKKPNVLLKGQAGVGKTQIVEHIANKLVQKDPVVKGILKDVTIYELPLGQIVSGASYVGQMEQKLYDVIQFAQKNNVILFIDEIHQIMSGTSNPTYDKIAQILKPEMGRGRLRLIGATTSQEAVTLMDDPAFSRRWTEVDVPELTVGQTEEVLRHIKHTFQQHHNVGLPDDLIRQVVVISDEYKQYGSHRPDTAITLMDKAMADARIKRLKVEEQAKTDPVIRQALAANPIPRLTVKGLKHSALKLLIGDTGASDDHIADLIDRFDTQIIGQDTAKQAIVDTAKRLALGLTKRNRPASFLFAGPSGTGKTEVAKQMAASIFGSKDRMIYINLSEYASNASLTRITGSSAGYVGSDSKRELPFDSLETNPYQLVLLDEFEKGHPEVQRFFMQALDEGSVKTNRNKNIDFSRTIIVATSNAGVEVLSSRTIGFGGKTVSESVKDKDLLNVLKAHFDVELLNRFEHLIPFSALSREDYMKVLAVKYNQLIEEARNNRQDLTFDPAHITLEDAPLNQTLNDLADQSYQRDLNGRPAERTIRQHIEDTLINNPSQTQFTFL